MNRIGLYGGSFDPVHNAHLALAQLALAHLDLDQLRWIPAGRAWQKSVQPAPAEDRLAMLQGATAGEPRFVVDPIELHRQGPSYTLDTVKTLQPIDPLAQWLLVIGQDQYAQLDTWHGWRELLGLVTLAIAAREGQAVQPSAAVAAVPHRCMHLPLPPMQVSATQIRQRVAEGQSIDHLVPAQVARYIEQHRLYISDT